MMPKLDCTDVQSRARGYSRGNPYGRENSLLPSRAQLRKGA